MHALQTARIVRNRIDAIGLAKEQESVLLAVFLLRVVLSKVFVSAVVSASSTKFLSLQALGIHTGETPDTCCGC